MIEKESSKLMLSTVEAQVCGVCCTEEDRFSASADYMEWLQCGIRMCNLDTYIPNVRLVGDSQRANYDVILMMQSPRFTVIYGVLMCCG